MRVIPNDDWMVGRTGATMDRRTKELERRAEDERIHMGRLVARESDSGGKLNENVFLFLYFLL
jgi:hypothetical protein